LDARVSNGRGGIGGSLTGLDLRAEIDRLRKERNAVILAHYYQKPEIQDLADFVGDSLDLSRKAAETDADVIAFCGVRFMAETAKILSPEKIVVLPDMNAGCSLEDSCPPEQFKAFREAHPDHIALTYINCSTEVKALSDIIVTSSSAEKILSQIPLDQKIIFGPDKNLGGYLNAQDRARDAAVAGRVHRARGVQRDRAAQAQGAASRRPGRRASRMPALYPRPCRLCRLDQRHPGLSPATWTATR
jgi:quinolinate synthase